MILPDYKGGSIVNLMSSLGMALGWKSEYPELRLLSSREIYSKNVVLIVLDGFGYEWLVSNGKGSIFEKFLKGSMTTVFPATTAAAINTYITGRAPQQHAITGWYMYLKELGVVSVPLFFAPRIGGPSFDRLGIPMEAIFPESSFRSKIKTKSYVVTMREIIERDNTKDIGYENLKGMFKETAKLCKKPGRKYVYSYWPKFDELCHHYGVNSVQVKKHFKELCKGFEKFLYEITNTDTMVIVSADHGLIDINEKIQIEEHPKLAECLILPLTGDSRTAYCYVHPSKIRQFEHYVKDHFSSKLQIVKSEELIRKGYFGLGKPNPKLFQRIGDYTLLAKTRCRLKDSILGRKENRLTAYHSGLTKEEMLVPLIVVKTQ